MERYTPKVANLEALQRQHIRHLQAMTRAGAMTFPIAEAMAQLKRSPRD